MSDNIINKNITIATKVSSQKQKIAIIGDNKQMMIIYSNIANTDGKTACDVNISWSDASNEDEEHYLHHTVAIPADAVLGKTLCGLLLDGKDAVYVQASSDDAINITLTFFEV